MSNKKASILNRGLENGIVTPSFLDIILNDDTTKMVLGTLAIVTIGITILKFKQERITTIKLGEENINISLVPCQRSRPCCALLCRRQGTARHSIKHINGVMDMDKLDMYIKKRFEEQLEGKMILTPDIIIIAGIIGLSIAIAYMIYLKYNENKINNTIDFDY